MKKLVIGILAHVDAGKTTLSESILYQTGSIRKLGRVDHKNTFLDSYELERSRGITIFSKQAVLTTKELEITLLDTPGHVDFSAEMERTLPILDYAILVISGIDGVQGHTETLWKLLKKYKIPTFLFINKMDLDRVDRSTLLEELKKRLSDGCVNFSVDQNQRTFLESVAMCDETLLDDYMESGDIAPEDISALIKERRITPCYFGSALKQLGVGELLIGLEKYTIQKNYLENFGAKVYKIARDEQGNRLTFMKITGGSLRVKTSLTNNIATHLDWEEKVDQIRIYSGTKYEVVDEVCAGTLCAVVGLSKTYPGEGLGFEMDSEVPMLTPVLSYQLILSPENDAYTMLSKLRQLEEEDPELHIMWLEKQKEIYIQMMGEVQIEILKSLILERFGVEVEFGSGKIVYKETIEEPVVGVGHFEPLRHYAEVHLLLEPGERGSGLAFSSACSKDLLDDHWQQQILTCLEEKEHVGVLTGSPITDMKITLIAGRAHKNHTEGGDFREATYRAVRQGLKKTRSILLEPYYDFQLEIPSETVGRAMSDIQRMQGNFLPPVIDGEIAKLTGSAPVSTMRVYQTEVNSYTKGRGRLSCTLKGYEICHNPEEVMQTLGYDSERDLENPTGSVFCANGSGFLVEWSQVDYYMHLHSGWGEKRKSEEMTDIQINNKSVKSYGGSWQEDKELEEIFVRTFGPIRHNSVPSRNRLFGEEIERNSPLKKIEYKEPVQEYLLVDGYNIIFSWDELKELAKVNLDAARSKLMDILCNYQGFKKCILILVFDAYKVKGGIEKVQSYHNIHVVYTKESETADMYIEKTTVNIAKKHRVTVATSDALEQLIIMGQGAFRLSANDLKEEVIRVNKENQREYQERQKVSRRTLGDVMGKQLQEFEG